MVITYSCLWHHKPIVCHDSILSAKHTNANARSNKNATSKNERDARKKSNMEFSRCLSAFHFSALPFAKTDSICSKYCLLVLQSRIALNASNNWPCCITWYNVNEFFRQILSTWNCRSTTRIRTLLTKIIRYRMHHTLYLRLKNKKKPHHVRLFLRIMIL